VGRKAHLPSTFVLQFEFKVNWHEICYAHVDAQGSCVAVHEDIRKNDAKWVLAFG